MLDDVEFFLKETDKLLHEVRRLLLPDELETYKSELLMRLAELDAAYPSEGRDEEHYI